MITIQTLIDAGIFSLKSRGVTSRNITGVFCCDLLSIAMGKAPAGCAWVTVTGNKNTLAAASLADVSCIILAEGVSLSEADLPCAEQEGITVLKAALPIINAALKIKELLS